MLVLSREIDGSPEKEFIEITNNKNGQSIRIFIIKKAGRKVSIGFHDPDNNYSVARSENISK